MSQIVRDRSDEDEWVTIDAAFVQRAARQAIRQYFRPITAAFENEPTVKSASSSAIPASNPLKTPRIKLRGYTFRKK